jgi:hypothetical protein
VIRRGTTLARTSEAKGHWQVIDPSAAFRFEVPERACRNRCRNFKSAALDLNLGRLLLRSIIVFVDFRRHSWHHLPG